MHAEERLELLQFAISWPKPLSDEFLMAYLEIPTRNYLYQFASENNISIARFRKKNGKLRTNADA